MLLRLETSVRKSLRRGSTGDSMGIKVVKFGEEVEKMGYREVELWPTSRKGVRMIYRDSDGNCFWFTRDGRKIYVDCLPEEEVDEETLKALEKDLKDMIEGKVKTISGDEAVKRLSKLLKKDKD